MKPRAIGFDLDGTLYPEYRVFVSLFGKLSKSARLFTAFAETRRELREYARLRNPSGDQAENIRNASDPVEAFHRFQAAFVSAKLGITENDAYNLAEEKIYRASENVLVPSFMFPHAAETISMLKDAGFAIGLLSDFPCKRKIEKLGLDGLFDVMMTSEETGYLKPEKESFDELAHRLGVESNEILYVGNNPEYDAFGAARSGMRFALKVHTLHKIVFPNVYGIKGGSALGPHRKRETVPVEYAFCDFRELGKYVLSLE